MVSRILTPYEQQLLDHKQCPICYTKHQLDQVHANVGQWCKHCGTLHTTATTPSTSLIPTVSED